MVNVIRQTKDILACEMSFFNKKKILYAAVLVIAIIPALYTGLFVMSLWDPYGNLKNLPVGIVSIDNGFNFMAKNFNLGGDAVEELKKSHSFDFIEYKTDEEVKESVKSGETYFGVMLPSDFSRKALQGEHAAMMTLYTSSGTNYIAMRLAMVMVEDVTDAICDKIEVERWKALLASEKKAEYLARPVSYKQEDLVYARTNGAAFAPYFMALSLWVGTIISTYLFKQKLFPRKFAASGIIAKLSAKWAVPLAVSLMAACLLGVFVAFGMNIAVAYPLGYVITLVATAVVYSAFIVSLSVAAGDMGKLIALIFLVLQISAAGGAYPIHTSPRFYQMVSIYCPLTNVVDALRASMFGSYDGNWMAYVLNMPPWFLFAVILGAIFARRFRYVEDEKYEPAIEI